MYIMVCSMNGGRWLKIAIYLTVAYAVAYALDFIGYFSRVGFSPAGFYLLASVRMFAPFIGVVVASALGSSGVWSALTGYGMTFRGVKVRHVLAALGLPYLAYGVGVLYSLCLGFKVVNPAMMLPQNALNQITPSVLFTLMLLQALIAGLTVNAFFAFGEEIGWRGLMQEELRGVLHPLLIPAVVGVFWGLWHAPLIILYGYEYPLHRGLFGVAFFTLFTITWSYILYEVRSWGRSVLPPAFLHGTINALGGIELLTVVSKDSISGIPVGYVGILAAATVAAGLMVVRWFKGGWTEGATVEEVHEGR